jgi:hypothetical protein
VLVVLVPTFPIIRLIRCLAGRDRGADRKRYRNTVVGHILRCWPNAIECIFVEAAVSNGSRRAASSVVTQAFEAPGGKNRGEDYACLR